MISLLEEQAALLHKHIAILKASETPSETLAIADGKKKNARKAIDPNKPKRAPSAYLLYIAETQGHFKASNPTMTQAEVVSILGKRWKTIAPETAERYQKLADTLKVTQDMKIAEYETDNGTASIPVAARKKKTVSSLKALIDNHIASNPLATIPPAIAPAPIAPTVTGSPIATLRTPISSPATIIPQPTPIATLTNNEQTEIADTGILSLITDGKEQKKKKKRKHEIVFSDVATAVPAESTTAPVILETILGSIPDSEKKKVMWFSLSPA